MAGRIGAIVLRRERHADMVTIRGKALPGTARAIVFDTGLVRVFLEKSVVTVARDGLSVHLPRWLAKVKGLVS